MHARSGGKIEVMGLLQGRVEKDSFVVMDAFALPVEATEVRVNAQAEAYEYMVNYLSMGEEVRLCSFSSWLFRCLGSLTETPCVGVFA